MLKNIRSFVVVALIVLSGAPLLARVPRVSGPAAAADDLLTNPRPDLRLDPAYIAARIRAAYWYTGDHEPTGADLTYWGGHALENGDGWSGFWWDKIVNGRPPVHSAPVAYPEPPGLLWATSLPPPPPPPPDVTPPPPVVIDASVIQRLATIENKLDQLKAVDDDTHQQLVDHRAALQHVLAEFMKYVGPAIAAWVAGKKL